MSTAKGPGAALIAIGGGKGGVGKTIVSTQLAAKLARLGASVLLVDADLGGANAHTVLGLPPPRSTLTDFLVHKNTLAEVTTKTAIPGLSFVSGALDQLDGANPHHAQKLRLLRALAKADADIVILDLGAGSSMHTLDFFLVAVLGILVVTPEPTSVENAYRFLKAAFFRRLSLLEKPLGLAPVLAEARADRAVKTPAELLRAIAAFDPDKGRQVAQVMDRFSFGVVVNQVASDLEAAMGRDMEIASRRFLGLGLRVLGAMPDDPAVRAAIRARRALHEESALAIREPIARIAERVRDVVREQRARRQPTFLADAAASSSLEGIGSGEPERGDSRATGGDRVRVDDAGVGYVL